MFNSKIAKAFSLIFSLLLILALIPLFYSRNDQTFIVLIIMILIIISSTISYIPDHENDKKAKEKNYYYSYVAGYLSQIITILVTFMLALWEYKNFGQIGIWFYVILLTITLSRTIVGVLIKTFRK